jgi:BASS family bile acid:Na+ symporter
LWDNLLKNLLRKIDVFIKPIYFFISKLFKLDIKQCRTISLEVGLQNSALASTLAVLHFNPLSALPGAIYSIWHNISGSYIATKWAKMLK